MAEQTIHEHNVAAIVDFISSGCKQSKKLGVEFENIIVRKDTYEAVSYDEPGGVREVLERLAPFYPEKTYEGIDLLGLAGGNATITLEPAATLEFSAGPFDTVQEVEASLADFHSKLIPILDDFGLTIPHLGYHPSARSYDMELIPKKRYYAMDRYFREFGRFGSCMMRCSASLQVSIDYIDEIDACRKLRIANALAPFLSLLTDNSPIFEARRSKQHLVRTYIWQNYDANRYMAIPGTFSPDFTFRDYAEYIMGTCAILVPDTQEGWRYTGTETFDDIYSGRVMETPEIEHALSMVWPDGRLKNFLEIRPADELPAPYAMGYVALIKGLFYNEENLTYLDKRISGITEMEIDHVKRALIRDAYDADTRALDARPDEILSELIALATKALDPSEAAYLVPLIDLITTHETLAMRYNGPEPESTHIPRIGVLSRYNEEHTQLQVSLGYLNAVIEAGGIPFILPSTDDPTLLEDIVNHYDGFLIPGGSDIDPLNYGQKPCNDLGGTCKERDKMELAIVPMILAANKPILGICRGAQVINVAQGGTLTQHIPDAKPGCLEHYQEYPYSNCVHSVSVDPASHLASLMQETEIRVNSIHHQAVAEPGDGIVIVARAEDGVVEGIEVADARFAIGIQWHTEYLWPTDPSQMRVFQGLVKAASEQ